MKTLTLSMIASLMLSFAFAQDLRFSFTETNDGNTSVIKVYIVNTTATPENLAGYTVNLYYDNSESTLSNFDTSPTTALGWTVNQGNTPHQANNNAVIPITHSGFGTINVIDDDITGTGIGLVETHLLTINFDHSAGTAAASSFYLAATAENHPALEYVGNDFIGHPVIIIPNSSFPVEFLHFEAQGLPNHIVRLDWTTASELNNLGFEIQRAQAQQAAPQWQSLGFVEGAGSTTTLQEYQFIDPSPFRGENLYRLRQIDIDGSFSYSKTRSVRLDAPTGMQLSPNPAAEWVHIRLLSQALPEEAVSYRLWDMKGQLIDSGTWTRSLTHRLDIQALPEGSYMVQVRTRHHTYQKQLVKVN